jgi:ribulose-phosphate 3-epimerase
MIQIIPAILATSEDQYSEEMSLIKASPSLQEGWIQIDFMDNKFVQNQSIKPDVLEKYPTDLKIEAHLMVAQPENWIDDLVKQKVSRIVFPLEGVEGIYEKLTHIRQHNIEVGISLNPETSPRDLEDYIGNIDCALVMTVTPGFQGQEFLSETLSKIAMLKELRPDLRVGVDGGVSVENIEQVVKAGADYVVIGSHLLKGDIEENMEVLWEKLQG